MKTLEYIELIQGNIPRKGEEETAVYYVGSTSRLMFPEYKLKVKKIDNHYVLMACEYLQTDFFRGYKEGNPFGVIDSEQKNKIPGKLYRGALIIGRKLAHARGVELIDKTKPCVKQF